MNFYLRHASLLIITCYVGRKSKTIKNMMLCCHFRQVCIIYIFSEKMGKSIYYEIRLSFGKMHIDKRNAELQFCIFIYKNID